MSFLKKLKKLIYTPVVDSKAKKLGKYFLEHTTGADTFLDVGCGDLIITQYFQKQTGKKYIGMDVLDTNLTDLPLTIYNGTKFPFLDNSFDVVYAIFSLHHCDNERKVLEEMARVAKKKVIIVEEPYRNIFEKYYVFVHDWISNHFESFSVNIPFNFHNDKEWKAMFKHNKLRCTYEQRVFQFPWFLDIPLLTILKPQKIYVLEKSP